jgi:hypothetical protein
MTLRKIGFIPRAAAVVCGAGVALSAAAGPALAWPIPITPEQQGFINQARAAGFPGNDDQILLAGMQACRVLYTGQGTQAAIAAVAAPNGASPGQAGGLVSAARGTLCTQAPG